MHAERALRASLNECIVTTDWGSHHIRRLSNKNQRMDGNVRYGK